MPIAVIVAVVGVLLLCTLVTSLISAQHPTSLDIDSSAIFSQVPTEIPLKVVTASQVIAYLRTNGLTLADIKPFTLAPMKASEALAFNVQGQKGVVLSYTDITALLRDASLFNTTEAGSLSAARTKNSSTIAFPTAKPTSILSNLWSMDSLGNLILLTDKSMTPALRTTILSHLRSLVIGSTRPSYPTPTHT